jgi:hypothetical protein
MEVVGEGERAPDLEWVLIQMRILPSDLCTHRQEEDQSELHRSPIPTKDILV